MARCTTADGHHFYRCTICDEVMDTPLAGLLEVPTPRGTGRVADLEAALLEINHDLRALVVTAGTMLTMEQTRDKMRDLADRAQSALESSP